MVGPRNSDKHCPLFFSPPAQPASIEYRWRELVSPLTDAGKGTRELEVINLDRKEREKKKVWRRRKESDEG